MLWIWGSLRTGRGGVRSVHAFAESSIGNYFVGFLLLVFAVCFVAYVKNRDYLKSENQLDSMVSRESSFLFNNLILLVSCIAVLSGTLFPVFSEWFSGSRISVGAPFFNKVNIPIGLVLILVGLAGAAFNRDVQKDMQRGSTLQIGGYKLLLQGFDSKAEKNYTSERMIVEVWRDNKPLMMLYPERRFFQTNEQSGTMVAIYSTLREDLYVVYAGQDPETQTPVIHAFLNPLVKWIWLGGLVVVLGR